MFFFSVLRRYFARTHTLPAPWSEIMARKNWNTLTEQTLQCGAAAFAFLKHYKSQRLAAHHVRLSHGVFSQFVIEHTLIQFEDGPLTLCLGHSTWGALCWPVREWTFGEFTGYAMDGEQHVDWVHIVNPERWQVATYQVEVYNEMIFMVIEKFEPLLKRFFGNVRAVQKMPQQDLILLAEHLVCPPCFGNPGSLKKMPRLDLTISLLEHIGEGDADWIEKIKNELQKKKLPKMRTRST